jgi:hypothetical protein
MSNSDTKQAPKGPSETPKGTMPKSHLSRWKTTNMSFATEKGRRGKAAKVATQDWKQLILLQRNLTSYRRLPANLRGALSDLLTPLARDNQGYASRRDKTGGETGEIVSGGIAS